MLPGLSKNNIAVELTRVVKHFGAVVAVNGVDLRIASGDFVTLLGPSGCGKTTILRMIAGLEEPTAGDILIKGRRVRCRARRAQRATGRRRGRLAHQTPP